MRQFWVMITMFQYISSLLTRWVGAFRCSNRSCESSSTWDFWQIQTMPMKRFKLKNRTKESSCFSIFISYFFTHNLSNCPLHIGFLSSWTGSAFRQDSPEQESATNQLHSAKSQVIMKDFSNTRNVTNELRRGADNADRFRRGLANT